MQDKLKDQDSLIIDDENDLDKVVSLYLGLKKYPILVMKAELGAGKTAFVKKLLHNLGSADPVSSPSFSIINQYLLEDGRNVYHMDLYRLESSEEALNTGLEEYLYSGDICLIEWPQIILDYIEEPFHTMEIEILEDGRRCFSFS